MLPLVDWVGLDIKTSFDDYDALTGVVGSAKAAHAAAQIVIGSGVPYEFRTTVHSGLTTRKQVGALARQIAGMGCTSYALQEFRPVGCNAGALPGPARENIFRDGFAGEVGKRFRQFTLRRVD